MSQPSKKQIKAQLTNEISKKYDKRLTDTEKKIEYWHSQYIGILEKNNGLNKENQALKNENLELKSQLDQYKDWIERMQEFCNLPESEREGAVRTYIESIKSQKLASDAFNHINSMFGHFFGIGLGL